MRTIPHFIKDSKFVFDAIVIGGGINGTSIVRDAALRGLKVLLLEQDDFSSGPSAWNSRMVHGGLRYLEYGELDLVRESLYEREWLLRAAPHLVTPLPFLFPFYKSNHRPDWLVTAGMVAYDILSFDKSVDHFHLYSRERLLKKLPGLNVQGLSGGASYMECQINFAERLSVENALAAVEYGAVVLNHARVEKLIIENNVVRGVQFKDLLENRVYQAWANLTINVAGPWVDEVLKGTGRPMPRLMGGTKGSHLVIDPFPGAPDIAMYYEAKSDGRPILVIPWLGKYLIGSTDIRYSGDLDCVETVEAEIEYIVNETNLLFPSAGLTKESVLYTYAGVRPLPYQAAGSEASITRRHIVHDHSPEINGLVSIIGGKWTTARSLAEDVVNKMLKKLDKKPHRCVTKDIPLPGAATGDMTAFFEWLKDNSGLPEETAHRLFHIYGIRSAEILELCAEDGTLKQPLTLSSRAIGAEIVFALGHEMAETLTDVMMRRVMLALEPNMGLGEDEAAASVAQKFLGWDTNHCRREVDQYRAYIARFRPHILERQ